MPYPDTGYQATSARYTVQISDLPGGNSAGAVITSTSGSDTAWEDQIEIAVGAFRAALLGLGAQVTIYRAWRASRRT